MTVDPVAQEEKKVTLSGLWRRMFLISVGAVAVAQDEVEKLVENLVEQGELAEKEGRGLLDKMLKQPKKGIRRVQDKSEDAMEQAIAKLNIPTRKDLKGLEERLAELTAKIDELGKKG